MEYDRNSRTIKFCADLFPAQRCSSMEFMKRLEHASVNLSISNAYFPANRMNCSVKSEREIAKDSSF